tara:strand:- start:727 stop:948 length:222 start_codon:yes stop_codon:yes gene_type:complete
MKKMNDEYRGIKYEIWADSEPANDEPFLDVVFYDKEGNEIDEINFGRYVDCAYEAELRAKCLIDNYVNKYGGE